MAQGVVKCPDGAVCQGKDPTVEVRLRARRSFGESVGHWGRWHEAARGSTGLSFALRA